MKTPDEFAEAVRQQLVEQRGQTEQDAAAAFEQNAPKLYERFSFATDGELLVSLPTVSASARRPQSMQLQRRYSQLRAVFTTP